MANSNNTIGTAYVQIEPSAKGIQGKLESALGGETESAGKSLGGKLGTAMGTAAKVGVAGVVAATGAITVFGKASVDAGKNFDASMSQVAATMGYSVEEINKEGSVANKTFSQLSNFAQQMGASTAFSASEAADALNYMALAGYDAETSMKMLPNVLNLAAAGGIELASASDMVTDAQSALGLSLDETAVMVDQMAKASSKSNTSVAQLGEALLVIGATGRSAAGGTKELSTMLGVLADNGIKSAEGGTHLRNIMLSLQKQSGKLKEELNVDVYDANGSLRDMTQIFTELNTAMSDMTDEQKTKFLTSEMFNKTDLAAVNALLGTSSQRYRELASAIGGASGAAETMAKTQLDNLEGDITLFQSALEGVQIQVSNMLTPTMREFVGITSEGLGEIATSLQSGDIDGAFSKLGEYIGVFTNKILENMPTILSAVESLMSAFGKALLDNMPTIIQTAMEMVTSLANYLVENAPLLLSAAIDMVATLAQGLAEQAPTLIPQAVQMVTNLLIGLLENVDMLVDGAIALIMGLTDGIIQALPILIEAAPTIIEKFIEAMIINLPKLMLIGPQIVIKIVMGLMQAIPQLIMKIPQIISQVVHGFINACVKFTDVGKNIVNGIWTGIKNNWNKLVENVKQSANNLVKALSNTFKIGSPSKVMRDQIGQWIPKGIAVGIESTADSPLKALDGMSEEMTSTLQSQIASDVSVAPIYSASSADIANNDTQGLFDLMSQYFPQMSNQSVNISLEGDAAGLFNAVRKQNTMFSKANGRSAFA